MIAEVSVASSHISHSCYVCPVFQKLTTYCILVQLSVAVTLQQQKCDVPVMPM